MSEKYFQVLIRLLLSLLTLIIVGLVCFILATINNGTVDLALWSNNTRHAITSIFIFSSFGLGLFTFFPFIKNIL